MIELLLAAQTDSYAVCDLSGDPSAFSSASKNYEVFALRYIGPSAKPLPGVAFGNGRASLNWYVNSYMHWNICLTLHRETIASAKDMEKFALYSLAYNRNRLAEGDNAGIINILYIKNGSYFQAKYDKHTSLKLLAQLAGYCRLYSRSSASCRELHRFSNDVHRYIYYYK